MSHYNQPRLLHDVDECVLLVSAAVYVCTEQHKILAHDERVLKILPNKVTLPFILLHQTGFTKRFVELCQSLCQTGMNFHSLEGVIGNMRWKKYKEKRQLYQHMVDNYNYIRLNMSKLREMCIPMSNIKFCLYINILILFCLETLILIFVILFLPYF